MAGYSPIIYSIVRATVRSLYFGTHGGLHLVRGDRLPKTGGVIIAPNHVSHLDPPAACCALPRVVHCMAKEELFENRFFGGLITRLAAFPVKRGEGDTESIRTAMSLLEQGELVLLFPEGTRGDGEQFQGVNRGVAMLAKRTGVPVVPVGISGTQIVMPRDKDKKPRHHKMIVACGEPFTYAEVAKGANEKENRDLFAKQLEARIVALCNENGLPLRSGPDTKIPAAHGSDER